MSTLPEDPLLPRLDKHSLQTLGFALIVLGIFLFMLGLIGGPSGSGPSCPLNGCPPGPLPWYWWLPGASFFFWHYSHHYRNHFAYRRSKHETKTGV